MAVLHRFYCSSYVVDHLKSEMFLNFLSRILNAFKWGWYLILNVISTFLASLILSVCEFSLMHHKSSLERQNIASSLSLGIFYVP